MLRMIPTQYGQPLSNKRSNIPSGNQVTQIHISTFISPIDTSIRMLDKDWYWFAIRNMNNWFIMRILGHNTVQRYGSKFQMSK